MASSLPPLSSLVDFSKQSLWVSAAAICFNPLFWNVVAQNEYKNKSITKIAGGDVYIGCYLLAITIFLIGMVRDSLYTVALKEQPTYPLLPAPFDVIIPAILAGFGQVLVISSTWALGITGTFLGDYFGILMDHKVNSFPFNWFNDPMYLGSTLTFTAGALWHQSPAGLLLTLLVYIVYKLALNFEGPFTTEIYAKRDRERALKSQKAK